MMKRKIWLVMVSLFVATVAVAQNGNEQNVYYQKAYNSKNEAYFVPVSSQEMRAKNSANAYGISAGDVMISAQGGYVHSINKVEGGVKWGDKGGYMAGASLMFFPASVIGFGIDYTHNQFAQVDTETYCSGWSCVTGKSKVKMDNLMFALRFNVNPNSRARFYIPLGAGVDFMKVKSSASTGWISATDNSSYKDFAWYAGLGFETSLTENLVFGLEARINGSHDTHKDGADPLYYATGIGRLGLKF